MTHRSLTIAASKTCQWIDNLLLIMVVALFTACAAPPPVQTFELDYKFCKAGVGGDWRVAEQVDKSTGERTPILFLFSVGGPYDTGHVLCAVSGNHAIIDLGVGKGS